MSQIAIAEGWYAIHIRLRGKYGPRSRGIDNTHYFFNGMPLCSFVEYSPEENKLKANENKKKCGNCQRIKDTYSDLSNYVYKIKK